MAELSIIVPVYNVEDYLKECIESLIREKGNYFEIILVDDGSPDKSPQICDGYAQKDKRIKVIHKTNGGLSEARNTGIKAASGKYLVFLDSDDWLVEGALPGLLAAVKSGADVIVGNVKYLNQEKRNLKIRDHISGDSPVNGGTSEQAVGYMTGKCIYWPAVRFVVKKEFIEKNSLYFTGGLLHEDLEWVPKTVASAGSFCVYEKEFYIYRMRFNTISTTVSCKHYTDKIQISMNLYSFLSVFTGIKKDYLMNAARSSMFMAIEGAGSLAKEDKEKIRSMITGSREAREIVMSRRLSAVFVRVFGLWNGVRLYRKLAMLKGKIKEAMMK